MKIIKSKQNIKCDRVSCHNFSGFMLELDIYKGSIFLCDDCFKALLTLIKRNGQKNEQK